MDRNRNYSKWQHSKPDLREHIFVPHNTPLATTSAITAFVHTISLVCATPCSAREAVLIPTILQELSFKVKIVLYNIHIHLPARHGTVVWYAFDVES